MPSGLRMTPSLRRLAAGLALAPALWAGPAGPAPASVERVSDSIVRIGIVRRAQRLNLRPEGRCAAVDQKTGESYALEPSKDYLLSAAGERTLRLGPYRFGGQMRLIPADPEGFVRVGDKKYRGSLLVKPGAGATFAVIAELGIEEYLHGVLPAEMSPDWPMEALKAQAVVARTFALANLGKFQAEGFDLSNDALSQGYADLGRQSANAAKAVRETEGRVLAWDGRLLRAFFHSCCGGHTCPIGAVWGPVEKASKPLRGVPDRYCKGSPNYEWTAYFSSDDIASALRRRGFAVARVEAVRIGGRDGASGFVRTIKVRADRDWIELRANDLRNWLGNRDLKSSKIYRILSKRQGYLFIGKGFGHGVGLCQWGAKAMAERGKDYRKILEFYFPGAKIETRDD